jgi:hypothetical protein
MVLTGLITGAIIIALGAIVVVLSNASEKR